MFNVRVKRFLHTEQIQIFSDPLLSTGSEREDKRKFSYETGEIFPVNSHKFINPFTNEEDYYYNMGNPEKNLERSLRRTKNKIYDIAKSNQWEWFFTLTFNPKKVDSFNYEIVTDKLSQWLKNMRKKCPNMMYLVVPEQHESGRWHFHGLFSHVEDMRFVDSEKRDKKGRIIYNVGSYRLGFSTATKIDDVKKACSYIAKYTTKELCMVTKGKKRYWCSKNVLLPEVEEYLVSYGNEELKRLQEIGFCKVSKSEFCDVTYIEVPIYTTNLSLFDIN